MKGKRRKSAAVKWWTMMLSTAMLFTASGFPVMAEQEEPVAVETHMDAEAAAVQQAAEESEKAAAEEAARIESEKAAAEEAARIESEKAAAEEAARIESEKAAAEEAARIESEKAAAEEAARIESEKAAAEEAARIESEKAAAEEAARIESEKAAAEEAARIESEKAAAEEEARETETGTEAVTEGEMEAEETETVTESETEAEETETVTETATEGETETSAETETEGTTETATETITESEMETETATEEATEQSTSETEISESETETETETEKSTEIREEVFHKGYTYIQTNTPVYSEKLQSEQTLLGTLTDKCVVYAEERIEDEAAQKVWIHIFYAVKEEEEILVQEGYVEEDALIAIPEEELESVTEKIAQAEESIDHQIKEEKIVLLPVPFLPVETETEETEEELPKEYQITADWEGDTLGIGDVVTLTALCGETEPVIWQVLSEENEWTEIAEGKTYVYELTMDNYTQVLRAVSEN